MLVALSHLYAWLLHDMAMPLGKSAVDAFLAQPGRRCGHRVSDSGR